MSHKNYFKAKSFCLFVTFLALISCKKANDSNEIIEPIETESVDLTHLPFGGGGAYIREMAPPLNWALIDTKGNFILDYEYSYIGQFRNGYAPAAKETKGGVINTAGQIVLPFIYDQELSFSDGVAPLRVSGNWGLINSKGDTIVPPTYKKIHPFSNGFGIYEEGDKFGFMDTSGQIIVEARFEMLSNFHNPNDQNELNAAWVFR
jgi:hypothetical protein